MSLLDTFQSIDDEERKKKLKSTSQVTSPPINQPHTLLETFQSFNKPTPTPSQKAASENKSTSTNWWDQVKQAVTNIFQPKKTTTPEVNLNVSEKQPASKLQPDLGVSPTAATSGQIKPIQPKVQNIFDAILKTPATYKGTKLTLQPDLGNKESVQSAKLSQTGESNLEKAQRILNSLSLVAQNGVLEPWMVQFPKLREPLTKFLNIVKNTPIGPFSPITPKKMEEFKIPAIVKTIFPALNGAEGMVNWIGNLTTLNPSVINLTMAVLPEATTMTGKAILNKWGSEGLSFLANKELIAKATRGVETLTPEERMQWDILNEKGIAGKAARKDILVTTTVPRKGVIWDLLRKMYPEGFTKQQPNQKLPDLIEGDIQKIETELSPKGYAPEKTMVFKPEDAVVNVTGSDLSGTPAGDTILKAAESAKSTGKNVVISLDGKGEVVTTPEGNKIGINVEPITTLSTPSNIPEGIKGQNLFIQYNDGTLEKIPDNLKEKFWKLDAQVGANNEWHVTADLSPEEIKRTGMKVAGTATEETYNNLSSRITPPVEGGEMHTDFKQAVTPVAEKYGLSIYSPDEYKSFKISLSNDKTTGYAIKPDGDLVSVFNTGQKGEGVYSVIDAIENGATKLDAYDGKLVKYYQQFGFEPYKREANWTSGEPDVVYMKLNKEKYEQFKAEHQDYYTAETRPVYQRNFRSVGSGVGTTGKGNIQNPVTTPQAVKTTKVEPQTVSVPKEQLPVGTGKEKASRLEARMKGVIGNATPEQIDKLGLSTYNTMNQKEQIAKAAEYVANNQEEALNVIRGIVPPPKGIIPESIYIALTKVENDPTLLTKLASFQATALGQRIGILNEINKDNPVRLLNEVYNIRVKAVEKRYGKPIKEVIKKEVNNIKREIETLENFNVNAFLDSIETCK